MKNKKQASEVELVQGEDGVYAQKDTYRPHPIQENKQHKNVEEFLDGVDRGFDFLESVGERIDRFLRLRKR